jgi:hypothetical protein
MLKKLIFSFIQLIWTYNWFEKYLLSKGMWTFRIWRRGLVPRPRPPPPFRNWVRNSGWLDMGLIWAFKIKSSPLWLLENGFRKSRIGTTLQHIRVWPKEIELAIGFIYSSRSCRIHRHRIELSNSRSTRVCVLITSTCLDKNRHADFWLVGYGSVISVTSPTALKISCPDRYGIAIYDHS